MNKYNGKEGNKGRRGKGGRTVIQGGSGVGCDGQGDKRSGRGARGRGGGVWW